MPHDTPLISTIVAGLVLAFIFGAIANRLKMPPLVGYLVAGVLVGPFTPGFVADTELANELSEIGVILLMFGVGLHFSLKDLLSVRAIAVPGAIVQIAGGTLLGLGLATMLGWSLGAGLIFGLALSVASTVVLLKALQDRHLVESERGRIAVGWLIVEDIAMILALVLIPALAGLSGTTTATLHDPFIDLVERLTGLHLNIWGILGITVVKLGAFVGFMLVVGRRVIPWVLHLTAHTGSRELFRLAVLAIALGVAAGSAYLFGVSLALGAFFAGMILSESELSNRAAQESLPFRDAFAVLFFVAVGMLFDPTILLRDPLPVIATILIIIVGKSVLAFLIGMVFRLPIVTTLTISASLAQVGEFSFILAALGVGLGILPVEGRDLILAGAIISIILNPLLFYISEQVRPRLEARVATRSPIVVPQRVEPDLTAAASPPEPIDDRTPTSLIDHAVLIGYGRVGTVVADGLKRQESGFVLIEDSETRVAAALAEGVEVVVGNAASGKALALANIGQARTLLIAIPNAFEAGQAVEQARKLNPNLQIIARAHSDEEVTYLRDLGANQVIMGEREIGLGMLGWTNGENQHEAVVERTQASMEAIAAALKLEPTLARPTPITPLPPAQRIIPTPLPLAIAPEPEATGALAFDQVTAVDETAEEPVLPLAGAPVVEVEPEPGQPEVAAEVLEAEIEAAHPEHPVEGPAEPLSMVPALGEMPLEDVEAPTAAEGETPAASAEALEAEIEAAHPDHVVEGPAEPLSMVPALGEVPLEDAEAPPAAEDEIPPAPSRFDLVNETVDLSMFVTPGEPAGELSPLGPQSMVPATPEPVAEPQPVTTESVAVAQPPASVQPDAVIIVPEAPQPPRVRPSGPASTPGAAFKPDPVTQD